MPLPTIPNWVYFLWGLLLSVAIISENFDNIKQLFRSLINFFDDFLYRTRLRWHHSQESKRISFILNDIQKIENNNIKGAIESKSKIIFIKPEEDEIITIDFAKKELIIRLHDKGTSENVLNASQVYFGKAYLREIKSFMSKDLGSALDFFAIQKGLQQREGSIANDFKNIVLSNQDEEIIATYGKIYYLDEVGLLYFYFLPVLYRYKQLEKTPNIKDTKNTDEFLNWVCDKDLRIENSYTSQYLGIHNFVYVRKSWNPVYQHTKRIKTNFDDLNCSDVIVSGWGKWMEDVDKAVEDFLMENEVKDIYELVYPRIDWDGKRGEGKWKWISKFNLEHT